MQNLWVWVAIAVVLYYLMKSNENFANDEEEDSERSKKQSRNKIYNFNTSWCGWSTRFQPEWNRFAEMARKNKESFDVIDVKCDDPKNKMMCQQFNVPGFPSVMAVVDGDIINYKGPRTAEALNDFAKKL